MANPRWHDVWPCWASMSSSRKVMDGCCTGQVTGMQHDLGKAVLQVVKGNHIN